MQENAHTMSPNFASSNKIKNQSNSLTPLHPEISTNLSTVPLNNKETKHNKLSTGESTSPCNLDATDP